MKLSELVAFRNHLKAWSIKDAQRTAELDLENIMHLIETRPGQFGTTTQMLNQNLEQVRLSYSHFDQTIQQLKQQIDSAIEIAEKTYFRESYTLYESMVHETTDYILDRRASVSPDSMNTMRARLQYYADWRYPGMIIRPGREDFIEDLVAYDPLYVVDINRELLAPGIERFHEDYQRRIRPYIIEEVQYHHILEKIPNNQFGLVFAYNYFNFRPLEVIKQYLAEVYHKLRPGGTFIMTFNDCDRDKAVMLCENHFCCYTPGMLIRELAQTLGYEIVFSFDDNGPSTWLELKKPGQLQSIRGGQTLAKIINK